ncbi:hypothetical protein [Hyphomicrobium sp.]|uniref:hypothetical protein n=1 Tax=Hyphomicrobium sp. TaxID=82 RepID=UPI002FE2E113
MIDLTLSPLSIADLDHNLRAEIEDTPTSELTAWEHGFADRDGLIDGLRSLHIVHSAEHRRGGVVLVGSGSSGQTVWTDAATPEEVLQRYLDDEMIN